MVVTNKTIHLDLLPTIYNIKNNEQRKTMNLTFDCILWRQQMDESKHSKCIKSVCRSCWYFYCFVILLLPTSRTDSVYRFIIICHWTKASKTLSVPTALNERHSYRAIRSRKMSRMNGETNDLDFVWKIAERRVVDRSWKTMTSLCFCVCVWADSHAFNLLSCRCTYRYRGRSCALVLSPSGFYPNYLAYIRSASDIVYMEILGCGHIFFSLRILVGKFIEWIPLKPWMRILRHWKLTHIWIGWSCLTLL